MGPACPSGAEGSMASLTGARRGWQTRSTSSGTGWHSYDRRHGVGTTLARKRVHEMSAPGTMNTPECVGIGTEEAGSGAKTVFDVILSAAEGITPRSPREPGENSHASRSYPLSPIPGRRHLSPSSYEVCQL